MARLSGALVAVLSGLSANYDVRFIEMCARRKGLSVIFITCIYGQPRLLADCYFTSMSPFARQYVIHGLADPAHAAVV